MIRTQSSYKIKVVVANSSLTLLGWVARQLCIISNRYLKNKSSVEELETLGASGKTTYSTSSIGIVLGEVCIYIYCDRQHSTNYLERSPESVHVRKTNLEPVPDLTFFPHRSPKARLPEESVI